MNTHQVPKTPVTVSRGSLSPRITVSSNPIVEGLTQTTICIISCLSEGQRTVEAVSEVRGYGHGAVEAGDDGGGEERSGGFRVVDASALSDAFSNSASEFQI
jgi:hypothetical protein